MPLFRWMLAPLVALALVAGACSEIDDNGPNRGDSSRTPTATETATVAGEQAPPDEDNDGVPDRDDQCPREQEDAEWSDGSDGCPDGIDDLVALAGMDINAFWEQEFADQGVQYVPPQAFEAYTGPARTGCGTTVPNNAFYCPVDHGIYFDRTFLERELIGTGDYGPVFVLAHEWGHLVQNILGVLADPQRYTIQNELQADCLAGVYTKSAEERQLLEEGDLSEAVVSLLAAGDPEGVPWFDPQAHGTSEQRRDAFQLGLEGGLEACLGI